jgi:OOP family OmpA-OmpF porin
MRKLLMLLALSAAGGIAQAGDNGFYLGAGVSQAQIDDFSDNFGVSDLDDFEIDDTAFKIIAGFRPIDLIAIEANYMDLGSESVDVGVGSFDAEAKAYAAYGLVYLPLPLPILDVYAKAGLARWELDGSFDGLGEEFDLDNSGTDFAYGAGAQLNFGSLSARLEWENFDIEDTDGLELLTLGVTWTFL